MKKYLIEAIPYILIVISFALVLINNRRYKKKGMLCNEETYLSEFMVLGLALGCIINTALNLNKMIVTIVLSMLLGEALGSFIPKKKRENMEVETVKIKPTKKVMQKKNNKKDK